jgi:hypothetical protein
MTIHLNIAGTHGRNHEQQAEVREAKRILKEKIRNDWEYGPLPQHQSSGIRKTADRPTTASTLVQDVREQIAGFRFHTTTTSVGGDGDAPHSATNALGLLFDPAEWRERDYSSMSDGSDEEEVTADVMILESFRLSQKAQLQQSQNRKGMAGKAFRFDAPDSVGAEVAARRQAQKRKRQTRLAEEAEWNDGLAHWLRRRDDWCGARDADDVLALKKANSSDADAARPATSASTSVVASDDSTPRTSLSSTPGSASTPDSGLSDVPPSTTTKSTPTLTPVLTTDDSTINDVASTSAVSSEQPIETSSLPIQSSSPSHPPRQAGRPPPISKDTSLLVPLAPPLLPTTHPIRARITPASYPEIYSKIILQSRTPSVPINLRTLLAALVAGWKADDEWPPKPSATALLEKSIGRKKASAPSGSTSRTQRKDGEGEGLRHGVKAAVGRVLRLGALSSSSTSHSSTAGLAGAAESGGKPSRRKEEN